MPPHVEPAAVTTSITKIAKMQESHTKMLNSGTEHANRTLLFFVALACLIYLVVQASWGSWTPYSFWIDELFSVTLSSSEWRHLINGVLVDVHPPLYQVTLKGWISLFGDGEVAARLSSMMFALVSVAVLMLYQKQGMERNSALILAAALFFASSWLFAFYAQTLRSYALLLLLSTLATMMALKESKKPFGVIELAWCVALLALSLTHYFGLLLALVLLFLDFFHHRKLKSNLFRIGLGLILMLWPIIHFSAGSIAKTTGGNFWIDSSGPSDTLRAVMDGVLSPLTLLLRNFELMQNDYVIYSLAVGMVMAVVGALRLDGDRHSKARKDAVFLSFLVLIYTAIVILIDLHSPISTPRNYIVLLPAFSILFGYLASLLWRRFSRSWQRAALALGVIAYLSGSAVQAFTKMQILRYPQENWRELAAAVKDHGVCEPGCFFLASGFDSALYEFYFDHGKKIGLKSSMRSLDELLNLPTVDRRAIIGYVMHPQLHKLREHYQGWQCLQPSQYYPNKVVLLAPANMSGIDLAPCM
jgi:uncharacterized membrane protein